MNLKTANAILDKAREQNFDVELYCEYSGKGMHGATTTALVVNNTQEEAFVRAWIKAYVKVHGHDKMELKEDTLGKSQLLLY